MSERIEVGDEVEILTGPRAGLLMDVYSMTEEDGCYLSGLVNECRTNLRLIRKSPAKLTPIVPPARDWKPQPGERVLVEATILRVDGEFYRCSVFDHYWRSMGDRSADEVQLTFPSPVSTR